MILSECSFFSLFPPRSPPDAVKLLEMAIVIHTHEGRLGAAARVWRDLGELLEEEEKLQEAIDAWRKAADCLSDDHQILTDRGFLFKDEVIAVEPDTIKFATYNSRSRQIEYQHASRIINKPAVQGENHRMVELRTQDEINPTSNSPAVSLDLLVTRRHNLFIQTGLHSRSNKGRVSWSKAPHRRRHAATVIDHPAFDAIRMITHAENGINNNDNKEQTPFNKAMKIDTNTKQEACLELYGQNRDQHTMPSRTSHVATHSTHSCILLSFPVFSCVRFLVFE